MDPLLIELYNKALTSHKELTQDDISYAINYLIRIYDPIILIHLDKSNYIGKFSPRFNRNIDALIKSRTLDSVNLNPRIDLEILTPQEQNEMLYLENILKISLINAISYSKISGDNDIFKIIKDRLFDLCDETGIPLEIFNTTIKVNQGIETGSILKISHNKFVDLVDLLKSNTLTSDLKQRYQKEIKILGVN